MFGPNVAKKSFKCTVFPLIVAMDVGVRHIFKEGNYSLFSLEIVANSNNCHNISIFFKVNWFFSYGKYQLLGGFDSGNYTREETLWGNTVIRNWGLEYNFGHVHFLIMHLSSIDTIKRLNIFACLKLATFQMRFLIIDQCVNDARNFLSISG